MAEPFILRDSADASSSLRAVCRFYFNHLEVAWPYVYGSGVRRTEDVVAFASSGSTDLMNDCTMGLGAFGMTPPTRAVWKWNGTAYGSYWDSGPALVDITRGGLAATTTTGYEDNGTAFVSIGSPGTINGLNGTIAYGHIIVGALPVPMVANWTGSAWEQATMTTILATVNDATSNGYAILWPWDGLTFTPAQAVMAEGETEYVIVDDVFGAYFVAGLGAAVGVQQGGGGDTTSWVRLDNPPGPGQAMQVFTGSYDAPSSGTVAVNGAWAFNAAGDVTTWFQSRPGDFTGADDLCAVPGCQESPHTVQNDNATGTFSDDVAYVNAAGITYQACGENDDLQSCGAAVHIPPELENDLVDEVPVSGEDQVASDFEITVDSACNGDPVAFTAYVNEGVSGSESVGFTVYRADSGAAVDSWSHADMHAVGSTHYWSNRSYAPGGYMVVALWDDAGPLSQDRADSEAFVVSLGDCGGGVVVSLSDVLDAVADHDGELADHESAQAEHREIFLMPIEIQTAFDYWIPLLIAFTFLMLGVLYGWWWITAFSAIGISGYLLELSGGLFEQTAWLIMILVGLLLEALTHNRGVARND